MTEWSWRPPEQRALLNPAFVATIVHDVVAGYQEESDSGLPFVLVFLGVPLVLHAPTRDQLPRAVTTSIPAHLLERPHHRVHLPPVAAELVDVVREGVRFGARHGAIEFEGDGTLTAQDLGRAPRGMNTPDLVTCRDKARFVGRWFARGGDPVTILTSWGLSV